MYDVIYCVIITYVVYIPRSKLYYACKVGFAKLPCKENIQSVAM